ncbi:MAG: sucrose synthase [Pirellulaceae bacterium]|jgi:sucrose synthase|nr:sucrose synthase [Pirellulaceae bacterium]
MSTQVQTVKRFCTALKALGTRFLLSDQVQKRLDEFLATEPTLDEKTRRAVRKLFRGCSEILLEGDAAYAVLRPDVGQKHIVRVHPAADTLEAVDRGQYLQIKDAYIQGHEEAAKSGLVIDFAPFFRDYPKIREPREMGEGISFLNRHLSAQLYQNPEVFRRALLEFLRYRKLEGSSILLNERVSSLRGLTAGIEAARSLLEDYEAGAPYDAIAHDLQAHGFEPGWGCTAADVGDSLTLLSQVLESSDPARFERLLARLPLTHKIVMVSPHGWFAQDGVLGKPDTGGQVTYVLDQARALERQMRAQLLASGILAKPKVVVLTRLIPHAEGTTCNVPREKIFGTEDSWIIRAPFRDARGEIINEWLSRFQIWPFLEQFAEESQQLVVRELLGRPDLLIGHYTDGNLVAHRLAEILGVTHCACVHALEKTKYLLSDMYWSDMEHDYRFSLQFTADLIAYNSADFILSSSYREVGGTATEMGMLEAYEMFSMPGLYRVETGLMPRLARHNIVPPGASEEYFFPYTEEPRRVDAVRRALSERFLGREPTGDCVGHLVDPDLPVIFAMARLDKIKNLAGLVEIYGRSEALRARANLLLVTAVVDAAQSVDQEEIDQVNRINELRQERNLDGHFRWCAARLDKVETGEVYRIVADRRGVFAQPAFMETFGLTVIEAMACGLPVVVTCYGGPSEIVVPGRSGATQDPNDHAAFAQSLQAVLEDAALWARYSLGGVERVRESFTWGRHAERVLRMANVYTYWNHVDVMNRQALDRYLHTLYHTVYRPRTQSMLAGG